MNSSSGSSASLLSSVIYSSDGISLILFLPTFISLNLFTSENIYSSNSSSSVLVYSFSFYIIKLLYSIIIHN